MNIQNNNAQIHIHNSIPPPYAQGLILIVVEVFFQWVAISMSLYVYMHTPHPLLRVSS